MAQCNSKAVSDSTHQSYKWNSYNQHSNNSSQRNNDTNQRWGYLVCFLPSYFPGNQWIRWKFAFMPINLQKKTAGYLEKAVCEYFRLNPDPFFFVRSPSNQLIYRSEVIKATLSPAWKPFQIPMEKFLLTANSILKIECFDWDDDGKCDRIGDLFVEVKSHQILKAIAPRPRESERTRVQRLRQEVCWKTPC